MREKGASILVLLLALFAALGGSRAKPPTPSAASPAPVVPAAPPGTGTTAKTPASEGQATKEPWKEPLRLYREFFGLGDPTPSKETLALDLQTTDLGGGKGKVVTLKSEREVLNPLAPSEIDAIARQVSDSGYKLEFFIALVPDPLASDLAASSDQALAAIQGAFAESQYRLDRFWLPWIGETAARDRTYRTTPGLLLFRRNGDEDRRLAGVFLVGETPKLGIHKEAFQNTLELIDGLLQASGDERKVGIVGPSFSGSAESLRLALHTWHQGESCPPLRLKIVTGTATARGLEGVFASSSQESGAVEFCRTVVPDNLLLRQAFRFLDTLGWKNQPVALLTESDTGYTFRPKGGTANTRRIIQVPFPSGLSSFRTESEASGKVSSPAAQTAVPVPKTALDLSLAESGHPLDIVPEWSPLTTRSKQIAISNLIAELSRDDIRRVGVLATDVRDRIFLAKLSRELFPDVALFSLSNDLLYSHPQYGADLNGMLVLSSFPLLTEGPRWRWFLGGPDHRYRRQFGSELEEGTFRAVQHSLDPKIVKLEKWGEPRIWVTVVGNGSLWPLASLPLPSSREVPSAKEAALCLPPKPTEGREKETTVSSQPDAEIPPDLLSRIDLPLLGFMLVLLFLAAGLRQVAPPLDLDRTQDRTVRWLLALGWASLWLLGAALVVLGVLPLAPEHQSAAAVGLGALYTLLLWGAGPRKLAARPFEWGILSVLLGGALTVCLSCALHRLWMPADGVLFFHLRARRFSSGLSPYLSLALWTGAVYSWAFFELKRRRLIVRQAISWPLAAEPCEPPLVHCAEMVKPLERLLKRTLPAWKSRLWQGLALALVPPALFLFATIQPVAEVRGYGWIFLCLIFAGLSLAVISFYQFIRLWLTLRRVLERLGHTRLMQAFNRIAGDVDWKPMRAFGWQMPTFQTLVVSAAKLKPFAPHGEAEVQRLLEEVFEAERKGLLDKEIVARRKIQRIFYKACQELAKAKSMPEIEDLFAARLVAYLRPVLGHMRNALVASLTTGLLTLAAIRTYAFQPQRFLSFGLWGALLAAVAVTLWIFVEMDRNATLSTIGGTDPGHVTFDGHFFLNVLTYGLIPVLGVLVSQFPQVSQLIAEWFNPLLKVAGAS